MSKTDDMLNFFLSHVGEWCCSVCSSGSNQSAAIFRTVRNKGYQFEEVKPNQWAKKMYCPKCKTNRSHYKLLKSEPVFAEQIRLGIDNNSRDRILDLLGIRDAFTGASIASTPEIDHKTPWTRLDNDYDVKNMSDEEIYNAFQILTREHNLLKDRRCDSCKKTAIRPPFIGISFWYAGDEHYNGTCEGCGWFDGVAWRKAVNDKLTHK